eukprot:COSAG05_NODE_7068_length_860_cov_1.328515_1_plen_20_part_01
MQASRGDISAKLALKLRPGC